jgi:hypothetical protein
VNSFTIESSFGVMTDKERRVILLDRTGFAKVGEDIGKGVDYWLRITEERQEEKRERREEKAATGGMGKGILF